MIKIGSLYRINGLSWMLFSSKNCRCDISCYDSEYGEMMAKQLKAYHLGNGDLIVFLESEGCAKKVLTVKGEIGWISFGCGGGDEWKTLIDSFEELGETHNE